MIHPAKEMCICDPQSKFIIYFDSDNSLFLILVTIHLHIRMPRDSAPAMTEVTDDHQMAVDDQLPIDGISAPVIQVVHKVKIDCDQVFNIFQNCDKSETLFLSPRGIDPSINAMRDLFEKSGIRFLCDLMDINNIFNDNEWFKSKFFQENNMAFWKQGRGNNDAMMREYKESTFRTAEMIASYSKVGIAEYLELGQNSWKIFSQW